MAGPLCHRAAYRAIWHLPPPVLAAYQPSQRHVVLDQRRARAEDLKLHGLTCAVARLEQSRSAADLSRAVRRLEGGGPVPRLPEDVDLEDMTVSLEERVAVADHDPDLWCQSASRRLSSARSLTDSQLRTIQKELCEGCPEPVWPYGNATPINPLLVTLGVSPGDSPQAGDDTPAPLELPPAGRPHPHVKNYQDGTRYWDKVRHLARAMATPPGGSDTDAYALFGNMNLDPGRSGSATNVDVNQSFAEWVLRTIKWGLRPRWLVCLGLKGKLECDRSLREVFESTFELNLKSPDERYLLRDSRYDFKEWELRTGTDHPLTVVFWPNHPSQHPFRSFKRWHDACEQFKDRHAGQTGGGV